MQSQEGFQGLVKDSFICKRVVEFVRGMPIVVGKESMVQSILMQQ